MKETAEVLKTKNNIATVKIDRKSECDSCKMCAFKSGSAFIKIRAKNQINAKAGDKVIINIEKDNRLMASFMVYIFPLIMATIGLFLGLFFKNEILMFILCVIMLILGYIIIAVFDKRLSLKKGYCPEIIQIIQKESTNER